MCEMEIGSWVQVHAHVHPRRFGCVDEADGKKHIRIHQRAGLFWSRRLWRASGRSRGERGDTSRLPKCSFWFQSLNVRCSSAAHLNPCNENCSAARRWLLFAYILRTRATISRMPSLALHSYTPSRPHERTQRQQNSLGRRTQMSHWGNPSQKTHRLLNRFCIFYSGITRVVWRLGKNLIFIGNALAFFSVSLYFYFVRFGFVSCCCGGLNLSKSENAPETCHNKSLNSCLFSLAGNKINVFLALALAYGHSI